jgi:hypothetical protein
MFDNKPSKVVRLPANEVQLTTLFSEYFNSRIRGVEVSAEQEEALNTILTKYGFIGVFKDLWLSETEKIINKAKVNEYTKTGLILESVYAEIYNENDPEGSWPLFTLIVSFNTPYELLTTPVFYISRLYTFTGTKGNDPYLRDEVVAGVPLCVTTNPFTKLIPQQINEVIKLFIPLKDLSVCHFSEMTVGGVFTAIEQTNITIPETVDELLFVQINKLQIPTKTAILISENEYLQHLEGDIDTLEKVRGLEE